MKAALLIARACRRRRWLRQSRLVGTIDYAASRIAFTAEQAEAPFDGSFKTFEADVRFDPNALAESHADVQIDTASVATSDKERDGILRGAGWFESEQFPRAHFAAKEVREDERRIRGARRSDDPLGDVAGDVSLHAEGRERTRRTERRSGTRSPRISDWALAIGPTRNGSARPCTCT